LKTVDYSFAYGKSITEKARAGVAVVYQTADIEQRKVVSSQLLGQTTNSTATLKGDSTALGLTVGMQFDLENGGTLGVAYKRATTQEIEGTNTISANFNLPVAGVGAIPISAGSYAASGDLNLPSMISVSMIKPFSDSTTLMADVTRYGWSSYDKLDIATSWGAPLGTQTSSSLQNYSDTTSISLGAEHDYGNGLIARAGIHFDPTPTNDTDRSFSTPDGDRTWIAFGLSKTIESGATLDFAYTRIDVDKSVINRQINSALTARATAESTFNIVSIGVRIPLD
jgi:long-chain fatty acid transport protein